MTQSPQWSKRKRVKHTGRGKDHTFLRLPHFLLGSDEFAELGTSATKLLLEVARLYKGTNNGDLEIVWSSLKLRGWRSKATIQKARDELLEACWLRCTRHGGKNRCSLYAITWEAIDDCPGKHLEVPAERVASHMWQKQKRCPRNWDTPAPETGSIPPFAEQDCPNNWDSQTKDAA